MEKRQVPLANRNEVMGPPRPGDVLPTRRSGQPVIGDILDAQPSDTCYRCPYCNTAYAIRKYRKHVWNCRKLHPEIELKMCPFNACHELKVCLK